MISRLLGATAGVMLATAGAAFAGTAETMNSECLSQLNMPASACACIGERAEAELSPKQQALVIAMVTKDQATSARLRGEMTVVEMTEAAGWMMNTPKRCAGQ